MVVQAPIRNGESTCFDNLTSWVREGGADLINVQIKELSPGCRGLFATEDLQPMTPILRIPPSRLISSTSARRAPHVAAVLSAVEADSVQDRMPDAIGDSAALLLFLMAELAKGSASTWHSWFRSLPSSFYTPIVMPFDQVDDVLSGTTLLPLVITLRRELREMYEQWFLPYAARRYPDIFPEEQCSYQAFMYAHAIIESRAFKIEDVTMLVPLADMANHQPMESTLRTIKARGWRTADLNADDVVTSGSVENHSELGLELHIGDRAVRRGEELCISYGALPNWQLLLHYGFAIRSNPEESVVVSLEIPQDDSQSLYMKKMLFLNGDFGMDLDVNHELKADDPLPSSLLASTRLLLLNEEESAPISIHTADFDKPVSTRNERAVVTQLQTLVESMLAGFDVFENSEDSSEGNTFPAYCAIYVQGQCEILNGAVEALNKMRIDQDNPS